MTEPVGDPGGTNGAHPAETGRETPPLERRFDEAMRQIYDRAGAEVGYWAKRYLEMLGRRGGLGTAHYLLASRATSDGYARLRDAGRLDLTVEAVVLQPEFEGLFSADERARAADRLERYRRMPTTRELEPSAELMALVEDAAETTAGLRIDYRDRIAAFGSPAIIAMQRWVDAGRSPGFAVAVIETVGRTTDAKRAVQVLRSFRAKASDWTNVIDRAIERVEAARRQLRH